MISLKEICTIGPIYKESGKRNISLLEKSVEYVLANGYPDIKQIRTVIDDIPDCADSWILWSEDKRWSPAWYLSDDAKALIL